MNRRKFLKKTSFGFATAAVLPLLSFDDKNNIGAEKYQVVELFKKRWNRINHASNKDEIWDHICSSLVLPSLALIQAGKNEEAFNYYADYGSEMKNIYLKENHHKN